MSGKASVEVEIRSKTICQLKSSALLFSHLQQKLKTSHSLVHLKFK